ncbi:hypothetical protein Y032_0015g2680 [Ancylostoma ceylanicum]|uniref:Tetratricopeptide repeat protein n=2 Tax=Ancylostoma ceylanicum TaxID=53326 RepID=A0A016V7U4_9BILA|nr:hypothetical protein Y032_0015g2680 [Ancylostoma ceylanicum]
MMRLQSVLSVKGSSKTVDKLGWLYRAAMACYSKGCTEEVDKSRLQWLRKAHDYALEAHNMNDKDTDVLSVLCSATGKLAEDSGTYEKIKLGFEFQTYLDKAIALCADSYEFLHMRGRLAFQVSTLGTVEKTIARAMGSLPQTSLQQALADLLAAEKTSPNEIENVFFIGKTYDALGDYVNAKIYLEKVLTLPTDPECLVEQEYVDEAKEILNGPNYSN